MRILSIQLRNYRGVTESAVRFARNGVTIVEGPNEIGKSSLAEALDRVIEDMDSTVRQRVVALKPVARDVGPEVCIEAESGRIAFRYRKRFLRDRITELEVTRPRPENLTGREAHDRVQAILAETVDMPLWKALRIQQGDGVAQAPLIDQTSLSAALDRAAGESPAGGAEVAIYDLVRNEYLQYWTETGRRKQTAGELERAVTAAAEEVDRLTGALKSVEEDVEKSRRLQGDVKEHLERAKELRGRVAELQARSDALTKIEGAVEASAARFEAARLEHEAAVRLVTQRGEIIRSAVTAREVFERSDVALRGSEPEREAAEIRAGIAQSGLESARRDEGSARAAFEAARAADRLVRDRLELSRLIALRGTLTTATVELEKASVDAALPISNSALEAMRTLHRKIEIERARAEAKTPSIAVRADGPLTVDIGGDTVTLQRGEATTRLVERPLTIAVAGVLAVEVDPHQASASSLEALADDADQLRRLLAAARVEDPDGAEDLLRRKKEADVIVTQKRKAIKDLLGDGTAQDLSAAIAMYEARVSRSDDTEVDGDPDELRLAVDQSEQMLKEKETLARAAQAEFDAAVTRVSALAVAGAAAAAECKLLEAELERRESALLEARRERDDESLREAARKAEETRKSVEAELAAKRRALAAEGKAEVEDLLGNAKAALTRVETDTRQVQDELIEVTTRLRDHGEDGLAEDLHEATSALDSARADLGRFETRASARRLLYDTFRTEREASRRSYVEPLRAEIERLGRIVFGPDFGVDLDDLSLAVVSRTLGGETIPFDSLSVGAREQIALVARLACATIVATDGGVPVILDDALGNSDPQRLESVGAALSIAGRQCQIIVLTCQPGRYEHVGGATTVRLG